jgi:hypothetical protein
MSRQPFHIRVRIGDREVELSGDREEVISVLQNLEDIVGKVNDAFIGESISPEIDIKWQENSDVKKYPQIKRVDQCSDAVEALLSTEWGENPRTIGELREAMEANAIFFPKTTLSGVLVWMVKKGRLRRWKNSKRGYIYVLNKEEN